MQSKAPRCCDDQANTPEKSLPCEPCGAFTRASGMAHTLAIDIGTSSVRAALFDEGGNLQPATLGQEACVLVSDTDGRAEMEPMDLLRRVKRCLRHATRGGEAFDAVGVSCYWHSLLGTDAGGQAMTPIYTWADSRCRTDAEYLRATLNEREVHSETGCMLRTSFWPAKLAWLRRTNRALFKSVKRWMSPAEWIQLQLTGEATCAHGMATGTGLYNPQTMEWSARMLEVCGVRREQLLPIEDRATSWRAAAWYPAIGDGAASNLGCGATKPGIAAINVGTSAAVRVMRSKGKAQAPFGLFCYRVDTERFLIGGAVSNAGSLHAWCMRELRVSADAAEVERELAARPTPEHGLTVLPFWSAERAPEWDEHSKGSIHGITHATGAFDLLQAINEAFYYRIATIADLVNAERIDRWIVSGGILHSKSSVQRLANALGRPLHANLEQEASLRGAAVFALEKCGRAIVSPQLVSAVRPSKKIHDRYLLQRQQSDVLAKRLS